MKNDFYIERVQVDEGFLDGLDLRFNQGLTVIIGARGTGKTSIVELVRFCLGAGSFTDEAAQRGYQQALSVLDGGQVTVTLSDGHERITVVRSASDTTPRSMSTIPEVTILAQGEVEAVGAQSDGRLHLIDRLVPERRDFDQQSEHLSAELKSVTIELRDLLIEIDEMEVAIEEERDVPGQLALALEQQAEVLESARATKADKTQLASLQSASGQTKVQQGVFGRALDELRSLDVELARISNRQILGEEWPESAGEDDMLLPHRENVSAALDHIEEAREVVATTIQNLQLNIKECDERTINIDQASREIRKRLELLEEGVGAITRRVAELQEKSGQLSALLNRLAEKRAHVNRQADHRNQLYRALDNLRQERFASRLSVVQSLTSGLGPGIQADATRSEQTRPYAEAIITGLRGSGLHYNTLGPRIAASMSPLELIQSVETRNPGPIAEATEISRSRATTVIEALKYSDLASIVASPINDGITLELLDGAEYKNSENVSIGQRCTTVLPVLLSHHGGILILDQPEDHLDNSFITSTIVTALQRRHTEDQLIFTSHNANIPVLGNADLIVVLDSDGKRGFVKHSGLLFATESVLAITDVMEGGVEAFSKRAEFYSTDVAKG